MREIDCKGMVLAPGFIDAHSHSDSCWFLDKRGESKLRQGVTTEVTGQCGDSPARLPKEGEALRPLRKGLKTKRSTFGEYLSALEQNRVGLNVVPLVGHGASTVVPWGTAPGAPRKELRHMKDLLVEALRSGAFGFPAASYTRPAPLQTQKSSLNLQRP